MSERSKVLTILRILFLVGTERLEDLLGEDFLGCRSARDGGQDE
jgi:hypothetical protein